MDPSDRSPADVIELMVSMFTSGDVSSVATVVDPDYVDHQGDETGGDPPDRSDGPDRDGEAAGSDTPGRGDRGGPARFAAVVAGARSGHDTLVVTIEDLIEGDDRVAVRLRWRGTGPGGSDDRETLDIVRVHRGRAVEHWGGRS